MQKESGTLDPAVEEDDGNRDKRKHGEEEALAAKMRRTIKSQGAEEEEPKDTEEEARTVRAPPIPDTPSKAEVEAHRLTHRPYRS